MSTTWRAAIKGAFYGGMHGAMSAGVGGATYGMLVVGGGLLVGVPRSYYFEQEFRFVQHVVLFSAGWAAVIGGSVAGVGNAIFSHFGRSPSAFLQSLSRHNQIRLGAFWGGTCTASVAFIMGQVAGLVLGSPGIVAGIVAGAYYASFFARKPNAPLASHPAGFFYKETAPPPPAALPIVHAIPMLPDSDGQEDEQRPGFRR